MADHRWGNANEGGLRFSIGSLMMVMLLSALLLAVVRSIGFEEGRPRAVERRRWL